MNLNGTKFPRHETYIIRIGNCNYTIYLEDIKKAEIQFIEKTQRFDESGESKYTNYGVHLLMTDGRKLEGVISM